MLDTYTRLMACTTAARNLIVKEGVPYKTKVTATDKDTKRKQGEDLLKTMSEVCL